MIEHPVPSKMLDETEIRSLEADDIVFDAGAFNEENDD